jgi:hypothetical protein
MIDREILNFYNSIKDTSWPNIKNYLEFCRLPIHIKKECNDIHGFQQRKNQIVDNDYWIQQLNSACVYKNLAYIPITKCAFTYYTRLFTNLGWEKVPLNEIDVSSTKFFGTMMHPRTRWLKGIVEWLGMAYTIKGSDKSTSSNPWSNPDFWTGPTNWEQLKSDLNNTAFQRLLTTLNVGDIHSMSYYAQFGDSLNNSTWIPMDIFTDDEVKIKMMSFFKLNGHNILLPLNDQRLHQSPPEKLEIFNIIKTLLDNNQNQNQLYSFYKLYANDLKFYYNLVELNSI